MEQIGNSLERMKARLNITTTNTQITLNEMIELIPEVKSISNNDYNRHYSELIQVYDRRRECKTCKKTGTELEDCIGYTVGYAPDFANSVFISCQHCTKQQLHFGEKKIERLLGQSMVSKRFYGRTFESFKIDSQTEAAYKKCLAYANGFMDNEKGEGLLLIGGYGTGKTHLAVSILHKVLMDGVVGVFSTVPELLAEIRRNYSQDKDNELIKLIKTTPFLVMDDLGTEKTTDWVQEQLFIIINARYEKMLPTVITSNCDIKELETKIGARTVSRIIEMCDGVLMDADDYRKRKLK